MDRNGSKESLAGFSEQVAFRFNAVPENSIAGKFHSCQPQNISIEDQLDNKNRPHDAAGTAGYRKSLRAISGLREQPGERFGRVALDGFERNGVLPANFGI